MTIKCIMLNTHFDAVGKLHTVSQNIVAVVATLKDNYNMYLSVNFKVFVCK